MKENPGAFHFMRSMEKSDQHQQPMTTTWLRGEATPSFRRLMMLLLTDKTKEPAEQESSRLPDDDQPARDNTPY
jgi:hypothetical protein